MSKRRIVLAGAVVACAALVVAVTVMAAGPRADRGAGFAVLTGAKEVSATGQKGAGDKDGRGAFAATLDGRRLCYGITVTNIAKPAAAHIHRGGPNVAGPIVQALVQPAAGDPGASSACVQLPAALASDLAQNPNNFYVNVHTPDFPGGAVRGQLFVQTR